MSRRSVLATAVQWWAGKDLYASAWAAAKHRTTNMTTLVALGTGVAWGYSTFVTLWPSLAERWGLPLHVYYETSLIIVALVLAGKWMEARAKKATAAAVTALVGLAPKTARLVRDGLGFGRGVALHAGRNPGYPASHGCIRLPMQFAEKLYGLTKIGSEVIVEG